MHLKIFEDYCPVFFIMHLRIAFVDDDSPGEIGKALTGESKVGSQLLELSPDLLR